MTEEEAKKKVDESWKEAVEGERAKAEEGETPQEIPVTFQLLMSSLGMEAFVALGEMPHPVTKKQEVHLPQAKQAIDLLTLLREKTRGNLTEEESKTLEELCYSLKLKYVERAGI